MKSSFKLLLVGGSLLIATPSVAVVIEDSVDVDTFLTTGESVSWTHDFTDDAEFANIGTIVGGEISVSLWDDNDWVFEFALGVAESGEWTIEEVDTGTYSYDIGVASLYDGLFEVSVISIWGDFGVGTSLLRVEFVTDGGTPPTVSVPEPATLSLLGAGLIVIAFAGRRRRAS